MSGIPSMIARGLVHYCKSIATLWLVVENVQCFYTDVDYATINQTLKRIHNNKVELLVVLDRPEIPLHTNGSKTDIREYVKKRKVSGGTHSDEGRMCRDTFASLKKTCHKLDISFLGLLDGSFGYWQTDH